MCGCRGGGEEASPMINALVCCDACVIVCVVESLVD